jgi:hypothetical protein
MLVFLGILVLLGLGLAAMIVGPEQLFFGALRKCVMALGLVAVAVIGNVVLPYIFGLGFLAILAIAVVGFVAFLAVKAAS